MLKIFSKVMKSYEIMRGGALLALGAFLSYISLLSWFIWQDLNSVCLENAFKKCPEILILSRHARFASDIFQSLQFYKFALKTFAKFTGKHLCWVSFVQSCRLCWEFCRIYNSIYILYIYIYTYMLYVYIYIYIIYNTEDIVNFFTE